MGGLIEEKELQPHHSAIEIFFSFCVTADWHFEPQAIVQIVNGL